MIEIIDSILSDKNFQEGLMRFVFSIILLIGILILFYYQNIRLKKSIIVASIRGFVQLMILASIITIIFTLKNGFFLFAFLGIMIIFGAQTASGRIKEIEKSFKIVFIALIVSVYFTMLLTVFIGILPLQGEYIIPIGGMVVGNSMNISYLTLNQLIKSMKSEKSKIEVILSLGGTPKDSFNYLRIIQSSIKTAITPSMNNLRSLGIVFIPGLMSGMIIGGVSPIVATFYQIMIFFLIIFSGLFASVIISLLSFNELFDMKDYSIKTF